MNRFSRRVRLFDKEKKIMFPSTPLYKTNFFEIDTSKYILMYGTGFLDKNGIEVYEDDTITFCDFYIGDHFQPGGQGVVIWNEGEYSVFKDSEFIWDLWGIVHNYSGEVVGNIHES